MVLLENCLPATVRVRERRRKPVMRKKHLNPKLREWRDSLKYRILTEW